MTRRPVHAPLAVWFNGRLVGRLTRAPDGAVDFTYARTWLDWDRTFPVSLSLPLREDRHAGASVIAVFDNLLPDNAEVRRRLAARTGASGADAYSLLAAIGRDCIGALQFLPEGEEGAPPGPPTGQKLDDHAIGALLRDLADRPLGLVDDAADFRISLAGAQDKTALLFHAGQWLRPHGHAPTTHILKPAIGRLPSGADMGDSVANEWFCLRLAAGFGLPVANADMALFDGTAALVVERFDRQWLDDGRLLRLPQEDCCQALGVPSHLKYESDGGPGMAAILDLLRGSDDPLADRALFLRAQIVFWLLAATDGHAKNFSLRLAPGGQFRLAPLYDILSAQPYADAGQIAHKRLKLAMAVGDNRHNVLHTIAPRHFAQTAKRAGLPADSVDRIGADLRATVPAACEAALADLPAAVPRLMAERIVKGALGRLRTFDLA